MKNLNIILLLSLFVTACNNKQNMLCKKWQTIKLYNPKMEQLIAQTKADIDTIGNTDAAIKESVNVDSFRMMMKQQLDNDMAQQAADLKNTVYEFNKGGIAYLRNGAMVDSAKWSIEKDNTLRLDEPALTGMGDVQLFYIKKLDEKNLELMMVLFEDTSVMSFAAMPDK